MVAIEIDAVVSDPAVGSSATSAIPQAMVSVAIAGGQSTCVIAAGASTSAPGVVGAGTAPFATVVVTSGGAARVAARSSEDHRHHDGGRKPTFHQS